MERVFISGFRTVLLGFLCCVVLCSCGNNKTLQSGIEAFTGSPIVLSASLTPDSTDVFSAENKLIVWFDSTECGSCRINQLYEWDDDPVASYARGLPGRFEVVLLFSPKREDVHMLKTNLTGYELSFSILVDERGEFARANPHIPTDRRLHAFLLDKNNRVVLVGNPLGNEPLWALYREQIRTLVNER